MPHGRIGTANSSLLSSWTVLPAQIIFYDGKHNLVYLVVVQLTSFPPPCPPISWLKLITPSVSLLSILLIIFSCSPWTLFCWIILCELPFGVSWTLCFVNFTMEDIYLTKRMKRRLDDDGIFCSCSPSPGSSVVCNKDCHCG